MNFLISISLLNFGLFKLWKELSAMGHFNRSVGPKEKQWAAQHFVEIKALKDVEVLVEDITRRLRQNQIEEFRGRNKVQYNDFEKALVLKVSYSVFQGMCRKIYLIFI